MLINKIITSVLLSCKQKIKTLLVFLLLGLFLPTGITTQARLLGTFDSSKVFPAEVIQGIPFNYDTPAKIREYLSARGSFLANYKVTVSFESDDSILLPISGVADNLQPAKVLAPFLNKEISVPELIWRISTTDMGNSCDRTRPGICINSSKKPLNPAFLLALLQKESGLVYGANSKLDPNSDRAKFLMDRATGYYCFENLDPAKTCFDQNPNWKYFKGFFRQLYYAARLLRNYEQRCEHGGAYAFRSSNGIFQAGSTVTISGQQITLRDGFTCSMYIYTPHVSAQQLTFNIMRDLNADQSLINVLGIKPDYRPEQVILF